MKSTTNKSTTDPIPSSRSAARNGKIARLPTGLRDQLGHRLDDGQPAATILAWLNAEPEVVRIIGEQFGGIPISPQNLSEWRAGGYLDWCRAQERLALARQIMDESEGSGSADHATLADCLSVRLVLALGSLVPDDLKPSDLPRVVSISRELDRHRRADRQQSLDGLRQAEWNEGAVDRSRAAETRERQHLRDLILAPVLARNSMKILKMQVGDHGLGADGDERIIHASAVEHGCARVRIEQVELSPPAATQPPPSVGAPPLSELSRSFRFYGAPAPIPSAPGSSPTV